ncbi:hypothetical protein [Paenibacillus wynnii]|uniref:Uncharacterized protein n=1 Tax=Paenibacillus wynnii TaxID=268407 RepID=A0A098M3P8_9BACL|nr:hypothetical protein [Paenibacillus wynnii]KGE16651.1 hypothetical protein PWYN_18270 [Paenibacillus wynnii]
MENEVHKLSPLLRKILHVLSCFGSYLIALGVCWMVQIFTIGLIPLVQRPKVLGLPIYFFVSLIIAHFIVRKYVKINSPYE